MRILMTKFVKKAEVENSWFEIDAKNAVVGRLATIISKIIRGKNKTTYTPHMDHGDYVVVKNIEHIKFTGKKFKNKKYYKGIKFTFFAKNVRGEIASGGRYKIKNKFGEESAVGFTCFMDTVLRASSFENISKKILSTL